MHNSSVIPSNKLYKHIWCRYCGQIGVARIDDDSDNYVCNPCKRIKSELAYNFEMRNKISKMLDDIAKGELD